VSICCWDENACRLKRFPSLKPDDPHWPQFDAMLVAEGLKRPITACSVTVIAKT
jgi:hypothetical protein